MSYITVPLHKLLKIKILELTYAFKNTLYFEKQFAITEKELLLRFKTYPADCRKIAAVDSNKHDWD